MTYSAIKYIADTFIWNQGKLKNNLHTVYNTVAGDNAKLKQKITSFYRQKERLWKRWQFFLTKHGYNIVLHNKAQNYITRLMIAWDKTSGFSR